MNAAKDLRFAVIGCGGMGSSTHTPNMALIEGAATVAYCDLNEERAKKLLEMFGGDYATTDSERVFGDDSIDGVLIQTGPQAHPQLVQAAARAGKHIFVEKPLSLELEEALETARVVQQSGVVFNFGVCNRLAPNPQMAKKMIPHPLYSYCQCAADITSQAVHNIDLAVNFFHEAQLLRIFASGGKFWKHDRQLPADSFSAVLSFADGSTHTYIQHGQAHNHLLGKYHFQLFGEDRCAYMANRFKELHLMTDPGRVDKSWIHEESDGEQGPFSYMGHYQELEELVSCIRHGGRGSLTVRDAAYCMAVEKAILESIQTYEVIDFRAFLEQRGASFLLKREEGPEI